MKRLLAFLILMLVVSPLGAAPTLGGSVSPDGAEVVQIDYPVSQLVRNVGGRDRAGLCVFTAGMFQARWQNEPALINFQTDMRKELGGGWPEKLEAMVKKYGKRPDGSTPILLQQYGKGKNTALIRAALAGGRLPAVNWNGAGDPHYHGWIAHVLNPVHFSDKWVALRDNNFIGPNDLVWMSPAEFDRGYGGWTFVLVDSNPPPPIPANATRGDAVTIDYAEPYAGVRCQWVHRQGEEHVWLYTRGAWLGAWNRHVYCPWDAARADWLSPARLPVPAPFFFQHQPTGVVCEVIDYGASMPYGEDRLTLGGEPIAFATALDVLGQRPRQPSPSPSPSPSPAYPLPDDGQWLRLTVSGSGFETVLRDLTAAPELAPWRGRLVIQAYPDLTHFHLAGLGFEKMPGSPSVVIQKAPGSDGKGKVLSYTPNYAGPAALAGALRQADPTFDPSRIGPPAPAGADFAVNAPLLILGGLAAFGLIRRKPESVPEPERTESWVISLLPK